MANINLQIPDAQLQRVIDALCASRTDPVTLQPIPPTGPNAKAIVIAWIKDQVLAYETEKARKAIAAIDVTTVVG